jgi:hypothetical protein
MPVSQYIERGWFCGLSYQEAPQADGEEEAQEAAAEDARAAQEQEIAAHRACLARKVGRRFGWDET